MKKLMAFLLVLTTIILAMPLAIADEKIRTSGDFEYTIKGNGTATIVGYNGDSNEDIIIPNMLDGYVVTTIGKEAFALDKRGKIRSATLPESITSIEEKAFWCSGVTSVNIPNSVTYIGYGAFSSNNHQVIFRISNNHPAYAVINGSLYNKKKKELLYYYHDSYNCKGQCETAEMVIPEGIVSIGDYACYQTTTTTPSKICIHFPSTLKTIGKYAFACDEKDAFRGESKVRITNESVFLDSIGDYAFYNAKLTSTYSFGKLLIGATTIGNSAFEEADIYAVNLMEGTRKIGNSSFKGTYLGDFIIPASVREVGAYCFQAWNGNIRFSENSQLTTIGEGAFSPISQSSSSSSVKYNVYLPVASQILSIGAHAFESAYLYNVDSTLNGVETIGQHAFHDVYLMDEQTNDYRDSDNKLLISASCKIIPTHAFYRLGTLADSYKLQNGVEMIESEAFGVVTDFYLPETLSDIAIDAFGFGSSFVVEQGSYAERWAEENAYPYSINGQEQNLDWLLN